jgi:hypothetical protein
MAAQKAKSDRDQRTSHLARLNESTERILTAYCAAAAAAGVSLLALVPSAKAEIVYTPADIKIPINGGAVPIDLNHDGAADFSFVNSQDFAVDSRPFWLSVKGAQNSNRIWGRGSNTLFSHPGIFASALRKGSTIGPNNTYFQGNKAVMANLGGTTSGGFRTFGQWINTRYRYLGLQFMINGQVHYGWARVAVPLSFDAVITGYAYETQVNTPIIAGDTGGAAEKRSSTSESNRAASLGELAMGAPGISLWRRRESF